MVSMEGMRTTHDLFLHHPPIPDEHCHVNKMKIHHRAKPGRLNGKRLRVVIVAVNLAAQLLDQGLVVPVQEPTIDVPAHNNPDADGQVACADDGVAEAVYLLELDRYGGLNAVVDRVKDTAD